MKDDFLKQYFQPPRQVFVQGLWMRLESLKAKEPRMKTVRPFRWLSMGVPALIGVLALTLILVPGVRAQVLTLLREVGHVNFSETTDYPGDDEPVTVIPGEKMSLEQAQQALPFPVRLPAWTPAGFQLEPEVWVARFPSGLTTAMLMWRNEQGQSLSYSLDDPSARGKMTWEVGENSIEEVLVNEQPAALVRGVWNSHEKRWDQPEHLSLYWTAEGVIFCLQAQSTVIPVQDLLRIAASIP